MAKEYTVTQAFQSTDQNTKAPQVVQTKGGEMHKFMVKVSEQPIDGWMSMLKKFGNEVKVGDVLYGDISENQWGKPQFTKADKPFGSTPQAPQSASTVAPAASNSELEVKVDYIISLLENFLSYQGSAKSESVDSSIEGDDQSADLSELPY